MTALKKVKVPTGAESDDSKHLQMDFAVGWADSLFFCKPPQSGKTPKNVMISAFIATPFRNQGPLF